MPTVWITFATEDNVQGDIDYLAQEIARCGWRTRMHPMFPAEDEKIDRLMPAFLTRSEQSDAWILYGSARALEQGRAQRIATVLDAAIEIRGSFPAIGLFPRRRGESLRLTHTIAVDDSDWRARLGDALGCDLSEPEQEGVVPGYYATIHQGQGEFTFECRPKMGRWDSFMFAIPPEDRARVKPVVIGEEAEEGFSDDAEWYYRVSRRAATPTDSYRVLLHDLPSRIAFGKEGGEDMVILHLREKK